MGTLGWVAVALLLLAVGGLLAMRAGHTRARRRWTEAEAERDGRAHSEHVRHRQALDAAHRHGEETSARVQADAQRRETELVAERDEARQARTDLQEQLREQSAHALGWELSSRAAILQVCEGLHVQGTLATNVSLLQRATEPDGRFVQQIDHVLVTSTGILLIEHKRWRGIIFDGVRPSAVPAAASLRTVVPEHLLRTPFALVITSPYDSDRPSDTLQVPDLTVRLHSGSSSPQAQARRQATTLAHHLRAHLDQPVWVSTCVYYAHHLADVHVGPAEKIASEATAVVAGDEALRDLIRRREQEGRQRHSPEVIAHIAQLLHAAGAHLDSIGQPASPSADGRA